MKGSNSGVIDTDLKKQIPNVGTNGRACVFGHPVDKMTLDQCLERLEQFIPTRKTHHLVLVNAAKIVKSRHDPELAQIINSADLVGADGVPIIWTSRLLGDPLPGRVNGTDLMERLIELATCKQYKVYMLGATQAVIQKAAQNFQQQYPNLQLVGFRNGYFNSLDEELQVVEEIRKTKADILLVGMGTPMKEKWVRKHINRLNVPVIHGVGGSFDIYGGTTKRAPKWMQKAGLEWLYRTLQEPRRMWKRYLTTNTIFIFLTIGELCKKYTHKNGYKKD